MQGYDVIFRIFKLIAIILHKEDREWNSKEGLKRFS